MNEQTTLEISHNSKPDEARLAELGQQFGWLVEPLHNAVKTIHAMPFFAWIAELKAPRDFGPAAVQLYRHSATFPKAMGLMLAHTPPSHFGMMPFYAEHAFTEATHHRMLMGWMLRQGILASAGDIDLHFPSLATNACINLAFQLAEEHDHEKWIVAINCGIELCSNEFFKVVAPKMRSIGGGDAYFDIHVEADEYHSVMGLEHISQYDPASLRARTLIAKALEGVSLWAAMIHSWIGVNTFPQFDLAGNLLANGAGSFEALRCA